MKIIEALKKIKDLTRKADDLKDKVRNHCADLDCESPTYPDQRAQVASWLQAHGDIVKEILGLRVAVQKTNLETPVTIELENGFVTKSIAEWIHRRKDLSTMEQYMWAALTDRGLKETSSFQLTPQTPTGIVKRRLYFDPAARDTKLSCFRSEPSLINAALEIVNAVTDLKQ